MEHKHNRTKKPEKSGSSAPILAALRAKKSGSTHPYHLERRRAALALASSRMAAKVALDKLEARAGMW